jgi:hypothetical protein
VRIDHAIWTTTGLIVFVAVSTQTNLLKNLINKVKNPPHGFYFAGPSFGSNESHCYQDNQEVPCGYFDDVCGYFDPVTQLQDMQLQSAEHQQQEGPNFTQPLVTPEQARKNTEHYHKHKEQHKHNEEEEQVYTQIECPDDPNTLPCGSNCYSNGLLWKTVCSEEQRQSLFPSNEENTTPYNFNPYLGTPSHPVPTEPAPVPSNVIPSLTYPEEEPWTYGTTPPSQALPVPDNSIHPITPEQNLQDRFSQYNPYAPSYQQPTMQPTTPGGQLSLQRSCQPVNGWVPEPPHKSDITASNCDCGKTKLKSSGYMRDSCRKFNSNIGLTDYTIYATVDVGEQTDQSGNSSNRIEITSSGPGIGEKDGCCGVGMDLNLEDGSPHIEIENWSPGAKNRDDPICDGESCRQYGWDGVRLGNLYGKPGGQPTRVDMTWRVSRPSSCIQWPSSSCQDICITV